MTWICTLGSAILGEWIWWCYLLVRWSFLPISADITRFPASAHIKPLTPSAPSSVCSYQVSSVLRHRETQMRQQPRNKWARRNHGNRRSCARAWRRGTSGYSRFSNEVGKTFISTRPTPCPPDSSSPTPSHTPPPSTPSPRGTPSPRPDPAPTSSSRSLPSPTSRTAPP